MDDRELLELAAKAAGKSLSNWVWRSAPVPWFWRRKQDADGDWSITMDRWNPLADDGDALRIAVKLRLWIQISERCAWAQQDSELIVGAAAASSMVMFSEINNDPHAATRRAIVRAAAAIAGADDDR